MDPIEITEQELAAKVSEWEKKKGRKATQKDIDDIYQKMLEEGSTLTDEQKKAEEKRKNEELTDAGKSSYIKSLTTTNTPVPVTEQPFIPRQITSAVGNLIDPKTGKPYEGVTQTPRRGTMAGTYNYSGMYLVDENDMITSMITTDNSGSAASQVLFQQMKADGKLPSFLQMLKASGHYSDGRNPSVMAMKGQGLKPEDYTAMDSFINSANLARYTPKGYLKQMEKMPSSFFTAGGSGSSVSYPNQIDISRTLRQEAFTVLGRPLTPEEIKLAVRSVKQAYASASGSGGEQAPSLQGAAESAVAKTAGEEAAVYSLGMALDRMFKGRGSI